MPSVVKGSGVCSPFSNTSEELFVCACSHMAVLVHGVGVRKHAGGGGDANHRANV